MIRDDKRQRHPRLDSLTRLGLVAFALTFTALNATDAQKYDERWHMCDAAEQCVWVKGPGGWPDAVHMDYAQSYSRWLAARAPYTTYFLPSDCFATAREFKDFVAESKGKVVCMTGRCGMDREWEAVPQRCTR